MKFRVSFKTPDVLADALARVAYDPDCDCVDCDRLEEQAAYDRASVEEIACKFIKYGEVITIEFDTEQGTATVVPVQK
jgi:hypothetical protein